MMTLYQLSILLPEEPQKAHKMKSKWVLQVLFFVPKNFRVLEMGYIM